LDRLEFARRAPNARFLPGYPEKPENFSDNDEARRDAEDGMGQGGPSNDGIIEYCGIFGASLSPAGLEKIWNA
jgi:hypothetical protein